MGSTIRRLLSSAVGRFRTAAGLHEFEFKLEMQPRNSNDAALI